MGRGDRSRLHGADVHVHESAQRQMGTWDVRTFRLREQLRVENSCRCKYWMVSCKPCRGGTFRPLEQHGLRWRLVLASGLSLRDLWRVMDAAVPDCPDVG